MELLRLLTLGRLGGVFPRPTVTTTITTRVICQDVLDEREGDDDDGPFFDLEFAVPLQGNKQRRPRLSSFDEDATEGSHCRRDEGSVLSSSPSGRGSNTKPPQSLPGFFLKFRVFKLVFHQRSRSVSSSEGIPAASPAATPRGSGFFVRFKTEEEAPSASLFARENSWRSSSSGSSCRSGRLYADDGSPSSEERKLPRYLSKIKPLYIRITSKRHGDKLRFSDQLASAGQGSEAGGRDLQPTASAARVACRRLRKSRSASAAVASVRSPPTAAGRRDDSLLEQQDGIQSAIAHCKRSLSRGTESPLLRSRSHPGDRTDGDDNSEKI